jgi:hypothetical protein
MHALHEFLQGKYSSSISTVCSSYGCGLSLYDIPKKSCTILDADRYASSINHTGRKCDFIIFYGDSSITLVSAEMKSGGLSAEHVAEQIQFGANKGDEMVRSFEAAEDARVALKFIPLLVHSRGINTIELRMLRSRGVTFRGKRFFVVLVRAGSSLKDIVSGS